MSQVRTLNSASPSIPMKQATFEDMIAYLSYVVDDVRALSDDSASLLEGAIAVLLQQAGAEAAARATHRKAGSGEARHSGNG